MIFSRSKRNCGCNASSLQSFINGF